jgi:hypothetical protein
MGCDIHATWEFQESAQGYWVNGYSWTFEADGLMEPYVPILEERSYHVFGILAGVRGDGLPIAEPRGIPEDCSPITRKMLRDEDIGEFWGAFGDHSASWVTLAELLERSHDFEFDLRNATNGELLSTFMKTERLKKEDRLHFTSMTNYTLPKLLWFARTAEVPYGSVRLVFNFDS